ncbi:Large neutral amino acids transporter small subunit 2 [Nymphon striatum]|nr:Large neutral amino acids transporter small subunit 2 [Nymphon striatum]
MKNSRKVMTILQMCMSNYLNFVIEELKDPQKNLPRAIAISCTIVTVVYTFTIVSFHTILNVVEVQSSPAVAVEFANRMFGVMAWIMPVFVAMSTFGGVNGILFTSSRLFYAGAEYGQMPEMLTMIQVKRHTPVPAVLFMGLLSMVYLSSTEIYELIDYVGFATWIAIGLGVAVLPYLRYKAPEMHRPIKVPLIFPIIYILASIFITICPMIAKPVQTAYGALIIFTSVPVYFIFIYWKNKPKFISRISRNFTIFIQKLLITVPTESNPDDV